MYQRQVPKPSQVWSHAAPSLVPHFTKLTTGPLSHTLAAQAPLCVTSSTEITSVDVEGGGQL